MAQLTMKSLISFEEAKEIVRELPALPPVSVALRKASDLVTAADVIARCDCPTADSSLKDGFAVVSQDLTNAGPETPVRLEVAGAVTAGDSPFARPLEPGMAVRIMTGSRVPEGATAVLASEFARPHGDHAIEALADAAEGRNILAKGSDVTAGELLIPAGTILTPARLGLLAAGGIAEVLAYPRPTVAVAATGTELVEPGSQIGPGQVAASNMVTLEAELSRMGIKASCVIFRDDLESLQERFEALLEEHDVVLTCGGVLDGDKDFTVMAMEALGVEMLFRRVRMGPGKGVCLGRRGEKLIVNLPGGPPSNHVAAVTLALPAIRRLMGHAEPFPPRLRARLDFEMHGQADWTRFDYCIMEEDMDLKGETFVVKHPRGRSRLMKMAEATCLAQLPEGRGSLGRGEEVTAWML